MFTDRRGEHMFAQRLGEIPATAKALVGILGQRGRNYVVEVSQIGATSTELGNVCVEVLTDDGDGVGMLIRRRTGEQMKSGSSQSILIGPSIQLVPHQLFWGSVGNRSHGDVGGSKATRVSQFACNPEVRQEHFSFTVTVWLAEQDVCGLDVTVQEALLMGVIEHPGDCSDDLDRLISCPV
jgi:hypothetical protein